MDIGPNVRCEAMLVPLLTLCPTTGSAESLTLAIMREHLITASAAMKATAWPSLLARGVQISGTAK